MSEPQTIITDPDNTFSTQRDLALEAAATLAALLDNRKERTLKNNEFTVERKKLEKRAAELIDEIRNGGGQLAINFGSTVATTRALAKTAPDDTPEGDALGTGDEPVVDEVERGDDEGEESEATH